MDKVDLIPKSDRQFKIDDTNTLLNFTPVVNNQPYTFPVEDPLYFQIKNDKGFVQTAKATVDGDYVGLSSGDIANLPVGNYELELWHMSKATGRTDIFPDKGWLPFTINENATGNIGDKVTTVTMKQLHDELTSSLQAQFDKFMVDAQSKIDSIHPEPGRNGTSATIMVGDTKQVAANEKPSVTNVGTDMAAILEFKIPVGAIKTEQLDTKDLNEVRTSGYYTGNSMTIASAPSTGQFILKVVGQDDYCVQLYYDLRRGEQYMRTMFKGEWNPWRWTTQWN